MARPTASLGEALEDFFAVNAHMSANTLRSYRSSLPLFVRWYGWDKQAASLTNRHLEEWFLTRPTARIRTVTEATYNGERGRMLRFMEYLRSRNLIKGDPMSGVRRQRIPQKGRLRLSADQLTYALACQEHPRDRLIMALSMNTALRASELAGLTLADVDLDGGYLYTTLYKNKKTDAFPISADLDAEIRRWLVWYTEKVGVLLPHYFLVPARRTPPVGTGESHQIASDPDGMVRPTDSALNYIRIPVHRALELLGYPTKGEGLHTIRRSVARLYYDKLCIEGVEDPLRTTQQFLNHASTIVTEKYLGAEPERLRRDESLRGKPFLSALLSQDNVLRFPTAVNHDDPSVTGAYMREGGDSR